MGQSFSIRDADGNAEFCKGSSTLVNTISDELSTVLGKNSLFGSYEFKSPLTWKSGVSLEALSNLNGVVADGDDLVSALNGASGEELFRAHAGSVSVRSLSWLKRILDTAESSNDELASVLEGCTQAPLASIFGSDYTNLIPFDDTEANLTTALRTIDSRILLDGPNWWSGEAQLDVNTIAAELAILQQYTGIQPEDALEQVEWENEFVDSQGRRAPRWRRKYGDVAYVRALMSDGVQLVLLVNTKNVHVIKGQIGDVMDYSQVGDLYRNLWSALAANNTHFKDSFDASAYQFPPVVVQSEPTTALLGDDGDYARDKRDDDYKHIVQRSLARGRKPARRWANFGLNTSEEDVFRRTNNLLEIDGMSSAGELHGEDDNMDDEDVDDFRHLAGGDHPPEHWAIHKLVKYLSGGNETATLIALCSIRDYDLTSDVCQFAIKERGLDLLVNLLETDASKCKIGALLILRDISLSTTIKGAIADLDGMRAMVVALDDDNAELCALAAETIANCAKISRNRQRVLQYGGIEKLVRLLGTPSAPTGENEVARCAALALWSCCKNKHIRNMVLEHGALASIATLVTSTNIPLLIPVIGILVECAEEPEFRQLILAENILEPVLAALSLADVDLQAHTASAISKCAEEHEARMIVLKHGGLPPLVALLQQTEKTLLLFGASGAIWKCAQSLECKDALVEAKAVEYLVPLLTGQPEEVLTNVTGAISELAGDSAAARKAVRSAGGIDHLVGLLSVTNQQLLINVTRAVGSCAGDKDSMAAISKGDGVRLLWSLLKSPNPEIQAGAAWAICPCIEFAPDAGDLVRSFVGGLELIVGLLRSEHVEVLASICSALASIAKDSENLAVVTDHGVVALLARLVHTTDDRLRCHLASAICQCCGWGTNRAAFGENNAVAPLVKFLKSSDPLVHRATARALCALSMDPNNCITMHDQNVVRLLLPMVGAVLSEHEEILFLRNLRETKKLGNNDPLLKRTGHRPDVVLQEAASTCIFNIRRLALANELSDHK
eukprot:m.731978 g.731978  ORF g.731978 m.731978 type:complete len:1014 (+) comp23065_c0_seq1:192-3233(+)